MKQSQEIMTNLHLHKLLELYDQLGSSKEARRIKVRILVDYYGGAMAQIGKNYLGLDDISGKTLVAQWGDLKPRLESSPNFSVPDKYAGLASELWRQHRGPVVHNYSKFPSKERIGIIRDKAGDWYSWLKGEAKRYQERTQNLTAKESLEELIEENLKSILWFNLTSQEEKFLEEDYEKLAVKAQDKLNILKELKKKGKITVDHVDLLKTSFFFKEKSEKVGNELAEIGEDFAREYGYGEFN